MPPTTFVRCSPTPGWGSIDTVLVQDPVLDGGVAFDPGDAAGLDVAFVAADVAADDGAHDPDKLAKVLATLTPIAARD